MLIAPEPMLIATEVVEAVCCGPARAATHTVTCAPDALTEVVARGFTQLKILDANVGTARRSETHSLLALQLFGEMVAKGSA